MQQWADGAVRKTVCEGLAQTRQRLGAGGAIARIAHALDLELHRGVRRKTHGVRSATEMM